MAIKIRKYSKLCLIISVILYAQNGMADDYFDPSLIEGGLDDSSIDLSVFNHAGGQLPGDYYTQIFFNGNDIESMDVSFQYVNNSNSLSPLLTKKDYVRFGVLANATEKFSQLHEDDTIDNISDVIPDAYFNYDFYQNRLSFSVPQLYINRAVANQVSEKLWDDGLNAIFTNYYYSGSTTKTKGLSATENSSYLNLRSGINLGPWRLRNYSTYSYTHQSSQWKNINTTLQRDIRSLKSQLTLGETSSDASMFDGFSFRGVKLESDESMLPSSQRGFAPIIRSVAQSNAEVTIRQNGIIIKQSYVPAGPFIIDDLYPTSSSGDLYVTIKESNGTTRTFVQPFSSVPIMLREGNFKYSVSLGQYRSYGNGKSPNFIQATGIYGLPYLSTVYGGSIISSDYKSMLLGFGKGLGALGSISADMTFAKSVMQNHTSMGSSYRFQYSKDFLITGTNFSFTSYRYSTKNFREFSDVNDYTYDEWQHNQNKKDKFQFDINQNFGDKLGTLHLVGYQERFWNKSGKVKNVNLGYSNSYGGISYFLNYSYSKNQNNGDKSRLLSLNLSIPVDMFMPRGRVGLATSIDNNNKVNTTVNLSGYALDDYSLSYNVQASYQTKTDSSESGYASLQYKARFGDYQLGYSYNQNNQQLTYSANGSVIAHPYGVTFGQYLSETAILVRAKDADSLKINNNNGVYTDWLGNAIVPYASPYEKNSLSIDTLSAGNTVDLVDSVKTVVPTRGAIVLAEYKANVGRKLLVKLSGVDIPFGASAMIKNEGVELKGIVDENNTVYLSGAAPEGQIDITWSGGQCSAPYKVLNLKTDINVLSAVCE